MTAGKEMASTEVPIRKSPSGARASADAARRTRARSSKRRRRTAWSVMLLIVAILVLAVIVPGVFTSTSPVDPTGSALTGPSGAHWFGTDQLGRDMFARVVWGARPVMLASVMGIAIATVSGIALGLLGGLAPPLLSGLVMRVLDIMLALPALLVALMVVAIVGTGTTSVVVAVGFAYAPAFARVIYSSVRELRTADYMAAASSFGGSGRHLVFRHLLPNLSSDIAVLVSSAIGWAVLTAGTLSFLGFGVSLPKSDWGVDLSSGSQYLETAWWISTFPGLAITATILLSNYLGDFVSDALDTHRVTESPEASALLH